MRITTDQQTQIYDLHLQGWSNIAIAAHLHIAPQTVSRWLVRYGRTSPRGRKPLLSTTQLITLGRLLQQGPESCGFPQAGPVWTFAQVNALLHQQWGVTYHPKYQSQLMDRVRQAMRYAETTAPWYDSPFLQLYHEDAATILPLLPPASVDCLITSPPYYGQRDYGVPGQLGLEPHPQSYIDRLVAIFALAKPILKPGGSLWVNLGDTYWSGKGHAHGRDAKQKYRRFDRPQDLTGPRPWCTPKQLLLIPHRFAIAMQEDGWIVRNDIVWAKTTPMPDPVTDRCSGIHEYVFHFVQRRRYFYDMAAVALPTLRGTTTKPPPSVWHLATNTVAKEHQAPFSDALVDLPIRATCPPGGVLLDPFCGSGTALAYALRLGQGRQVIGIDISRAALEEAYACLVGAGTEEETHREAAVPKKARP